MPQARREPARLQRSPHLVAYWLADTFLLHNYATGVRAHASATACAILEHCAQPRSLAEIQATRPGASRTIVRRLVERLVALTFLQRSDRPPDPREVAMSALDRWNPPAGFFHASTRNVRFAAAARAEAALARQARAWPMPPPCKRIPDAQTTGLPPVRVAGEFPQVLLSRRTWRRFSRQPMTLEDLSTLLGLTCGVQHWVRAGGRELALKTSPSGGARHPIECYVVARDVLGLKPGRYHYAADAHLLERLKGRVSREGVEKYFPRSPQLAKAPAVVFFSAVFERQTWRYPYARAYRAALVEAGHVCQTFCLTATWLGLAPFSIMGLADDRIERDLDLDGMSEAVLYAAGVGRPPGRTAWAPLARGHLRRRPNPAFGG